MNQPASNGISLRQLGDAISATLQGDGSLLITGVNSPESATPGELAYLTDERHLEIAQRSRASAFIVPKYFEQLRTPQLIASNPQYAFVQAINCFFPQAAPAPGIAKECWQGKDVSIGQDASIGPFVTLGDRVTIGERVTIYPGVYIGENVTIGNDSIFFPRVTILDRCKVGNNVIIHSGDRHRKRWIWLRTTWRGASQNSSARQRRY